jgi:exonuclease III
MGFGNKFEALLSLNPDIAVVPECSEKSIDYLKRLGYGALWFGSNPLKGLGVFCRKDWSLRALPQPSQSWIVPIEVDAPTPFTLIAVWACQVGTKRADHYIGQVHQAITSHPEWFGRGPLVIAGDLNSNKKWDSERKVGNHSEVVRILSERGLVSGYHGHFSEEQGMETRPTLYLHRHLHRPDHIDYVFIPREWLPHVISVEVGKYEKWSKLSDHCPVIVEIAR